MIEVLAKKLKRVLADEAIGIENQNLFDSGQKEDTAEFRAEYESYRIWQKSGQVLAGVILGTAVGSLFGIVFAMELLTVSNIFLFIL